MKMMLFIECIIGCILFGVGIVGSVLINKEFWLQEYDPSVQKKYLSLHPEYRPADAASNIVSIMIKKIIVSLLFILILVVMVYIAGARNFTYGFIYCYTIWFVVDWFDALVIDILILANWKKVRLPGTEDMDREYKSNKRKRIIDAFLGMAIGIVIAIIVAGIVELLF